MCCRVVVGDPVAVGRQEHPLDTRMSYDFHPAALALSPWRWQDQIFSRQTPPTLLDQPCLHALALNCVSEFIGFLWQQSPCFRLCAGPWMMEPATGGGSGALRTSCSSPEDPCLPKPHCFLAWEEEAL